MVNLVFCRVFAFKSVGNCLLHLLASTVVDNLGVLPFLLWLGLGLGYATNVNLYYGEAIWCHPRNFYVDKRGDMRLAITLPTFFVALPPLNVAPWYLEFPTVIVLKINFKQAFTLTKGVTCWAVAYQAIFLSVKLDR